MATRKAQKAVNQAVGETPETAPEVKEAEAKTEKTAVKKARPARKPAAKTRKPAVPKAKEAAVEPQGPVFKPRERKTRKFMLLLKPSVFEFVQNYANVRYTSVNDIINTLVEDFVNREGQ